MNVKQLPSNGKFYTYVFVEKDETVDMHKVTEEFGDNPIVIIRNGEQPFKETIVHALQYIRDNPLT